MHKVKKGIFLNKAFLYTVQSNESLYDFEEL